MHASTTKDLLASLRLGDPADVSWLFSAEQSTAFLRLNAAHDEIVIYASSQSSMVHAVLAPTRKLTGASVSDLQHRSPPMPDDAWRIQQVWGGGRGHRMYLEPPLSSVAECLVGGEKLVFRRPFDGVDKEPPQIELSQKLVHALDLHFLSERSAFCRLDSHGDIEDVIRIVQSRGKQESDRFDAVVMRRSDLDKYMALSKQALVVRFDFTRVHWGSFAGWGNIQRFAKDEADLYYHGGTSANGSFCNGVMVVRPQITVAQLVQSWKASERRQSTDYARFKIYDRKNGRNVETSCAPEYLSNYFQESDLPWEVSPAFFRPDVLHKYKMDPEKYSLSERSISCRNSWHLKTYDINEAGQVHTYIGYLADLPYAEQLYWQSFNEWPKGDISRRAFQTDIVGDWHLEYEPLGSLKQAVTALDTVAPAWWKQRGRDLLDVVNYPAADSIKDWTDEILALDQLVVEGFLTTPLRELAAEGGGAIKQEWQSLRLLQEVLVARGHSVGEAQGVVEPLQRLHSLRTLVKGHSAVEKKRAAVAAARTDFVTLRGHFRQLVADCDGALDRIVRALGVTIRKRQ